MTVGATLVVLAAAALARWGWRRYHAAIWHAQQRAEAAEWRAQAAEQRLARRTRRVCRRRIKPGPGLRRCTTHFAPCGPGGCDD